MDVSEFVATSLQQVVEGVATAKEAIEVAGGAVNPSFARIKHEEMNAWIVEDGRWVQVQDVSFDIAVTTTSEEGTEGGLRIAAALISAGASTGSATAETAVSRLRFTVPLALPPGRADEYQVRPQPRSRRVRQSGWNPRV